MPTPVLPTAIDPSGEAFRANADGMLGLLGQIGGLLQEASLGGGSDEVMLQILARLDGFTG